MPDQVLRYGAKASLLGADNAWNLWNQHCTGRPGDDNTVRHHRVRQRLPYARNAQLWTERTLADFSFAVKAFHLFTLHHTAPDAFPKDIRAALDPATKKSLYYAGLPAELAIERWSRFRTALLP